MLRGLLRWGRKVQKKVLTFFIEWVEVCVVWGFPPDSSQFHTGISIESSHSLDSLPDFPYEETDRHHLPDTCRASWKCGEMTEEGPWDKKRELHTVNVKMTYMV